MLIHRDKAGHYFLLSFLFFTFTLQGCLALNRDRLQADISQKQGSYYNTRGENGDLVEPGLRTLKLSVNGYYFGQKDLDFGDLDGSHSTAVLCVNKELLSIFNLRAEVSAKLPKRECLRINDISPKAYYELDVSNSLMGVTLPKEVLSLNN